ncbi:MAG: solute carrier family 23 protein [Pseudomonadota bacterium]
MAFVSFATAIAVVLFGKKFLSNIPILTGILVGYFLSIFFGVIDFSIVENAAWFSIPCVALTKSFKPLYMVIAAFTAITLSFLGKLGAILKTIPIPVMGGILILLFGMIATIGINSLVKAKVDLSKAQNLVIVSTILVLGIGDMQLSIGSYCPGGIGLAGLVGIILNYILMKYQSKDL